MPSGSRPRKAIFPVGGLGTRFLPVTKAVPKELLPVLEKPLIHYAYEEARQAGCEEFIFVTGRGKGAIENYFDHNHELTQTLRERGDDRLLAGLEAWQPGPGQTIWLRQGAARGLGHAIWCAREVVGSEPVCVLLADELLPGDLPGTPGPCLSRMVERYRPAMGSLVALQEVPEARVGQYGIADTGGKAPPTGPETFRLEGVVEKPAPGEAPSRLGIIGRYILHPGVFRALDALVRQAPPDGGEIQLTDALALTAGSEGLHGMLWQGARFDCGNRQGWLHASLALALADPETRETTRALLDDLTQQKPVR